MQQSNNSWAPIWCLGWVVLYFQHLNLRCAAFHSVSPRFAVRQTQRPVIGWVSGSHWLRQGPRNHALKATVSGPITITSAGSNSSSDQESSSEPQLLELFPPTVAYRTGTLRVDDIHTLYYEVHGPATHNDDSRQHGNLTALFLHGGPGAGCTPTHARYFDPHHYGTIVLFDQRGAGASTPRGCVWNNTLETLVQDCEALRMHLGIDRWDVVLGGSWGSTLALAYAQDFPTNVASLILRGVCLMRPQEIDWLFHPQGGAAKRNPQAWKAFQAAVGVNDMDDDNSDYGGCDETNEGGRQVLHAYYDRLLGNNDTMRWSAARSFMMYELAISNMFRSSPDDYITPLPASSTDQQGNNHHNTTNAANINSTTTTLQQNSSSKTGNGITLNSPKPTSDSTPKSPAVMVSAAPFPLEPWCYQDSHGSTLTSTQRMRRGLKPIDRQLEELTRGLTDFSSLDRGNTLSPRSFSMSWHDMEAQPQNSSNGTGLPAMAMLTCFYSVNELYAMNNQQLVSPQRMERVRKAGIPCIAVQGGWDFICPPDTALEVQRMWPEMELRIPLYAGHSMYHPEIVHELVKATDRMAFTVRGRKTE